MLIAQAVPPLWILYLAFVGPLFVFAAFFLLAISPCRFAAGPVVVGFAVVLISINFFGFFFSLLEISTCYAISWNSVLYWICGRERGYLETAWWIDPLFYALAIVALFGAMWNVRLREGRGVQSPT